MIARERAAMMYQPQSAAAIARLIAEYPLAWIVSGGAEGFAATPLPLLAETGDGGTVTALLGHFARTNPQVGALHEAPTATILFQGPHGYVSPGLLSNRNWAPTWNYAVVRIDVRIEFVPEENGRALETLVATMERGRERPWTPAELGDRYAALAPRIIAFRAHVQAIHATFKLGQDERAATFAEIVGGLGDPVLAAWMAEFGGPDR
jgi:transcriptional regulator